MSNLQGEGLEIDHTEAHPSPRIACPSQHNMMVDGYIGEDAPIHRLHVHLIGEDRDVDVG